MINCAKTRNIFPLVDVLVIMLYLTIQPQIVQTCRAASSNAAPPKTQSNAETSSIYLTSTPRGCSERLETLDCAEQTATNVYSYVQNTVSSSKTGSPIGAELTTHPSKFIVDSRISSRCLDRSKKYYDVCFRKGIVRSPHLAVRFAGRSLRVAQTCHMLAMRNLELCQNQQLLVAN